MSDTVLILKVRKSRYERELLNLGKLFRKPSIVLVGGFCGNIVGKIKSVELNNV